MQQTKAGEADRTASDDGGSQDGGQSPQARTKRTRQERSREKRDRILDALDRLLHEHAFPDITIADIAREAGVSPATIYQRFRNDDAAVAILLELYYRRVEDWARRPRENAPAPNRGLYDSLLDIGWDAWEQMAALGHVMRPAYLYSRLKPHLAGPEWARLEKVAAQGFKGFLQQHADALPARDLDKAAQSLCLFYNFMLAGALLHGDGAGGSFVADRESFARELADYAYRYLTAPTGGVA